MIDRGLVVALLAIAAAPLQAQLPDLDKVEIRATALAPNVYMLTGGGGNMALLTGADGAVLVDDQFAPLAPRIRAQIARLTDRPLRFVINTHWHFDHTGGNEAFGGAGSVIVAHENTHRRMSTRQVVDFFNVETPPAPPAALPVVTFGEGVTLRLNGERISIRHAPNAHTDSDAILYFENSGVVHMGDVFVLGSYPFIDMGSGGSIEGVIAAAARTLAGTAADAKIIPGHGPLATRSDLQQYHDMLVTVRGRVADMIRKGRSLEQVLAARPTAEFDARYGKGAMTPDVWLQRVYVDLARGLRKAPRRG